MAPKGEAKSPGKPGPIDPAFAAAVDEAQRETERLLAEDPSRKNDPTLPIFRFAARQSLEANRVRFEAGDRMALLAAIRICANHDLVMPTWVSRGFIKGYDSVLCCKVGSWDEAFGSPLPKGQHLAARRKKREKKFAVLNAVNEARRQGRGVGDELFEEIGLKLGLGKTLVGEYYYDAERLLGPYKVPEKSQTLRKDPKTPRK